MNDGRLKGDAVSVSVWIDGIGEAIAHEPDTPLRPASTQKILTAMGVLAYLDPNERLRTDLVATGPTTDGVLDGDLVLVGGGDPSVTHAGPHSIDALAKAVADQGITRITGRILVDEGRYDTERNAPGVPPKWWNDIGSLSALAVDHNWARLDPEFLADPARFAGDMLRTALLFHGVAVGGDTAHGSPRQGIKIAGIESATINELVNLMLRRSDNFYAEMLTKEIAFRRDHTRGTTAGGVALIRDLVKRLCVPLRGIDSDASGLSYEDRRSARELRRALQASQTQPWGSLLLADLPVAGASDAFGGRLKGPATSGRVRAKGGRLDIARSLAGFTATRSGRSVVFAVIINGPNLKGAEAAIDDFVTAIASTDV